MPELPEVETVCQGLNQVTLNQEIGGGDVLLARTIAYPFSVSEFLSGLKSTSITRWHRRGKYLLAQLAKSDLCDEGVRIQESGVRGDKNPKPVRRTRTEDGKI